MNAADPSPADGPNVEPTTPLHAAAPVYGLVFWLAYAANTSLVTANALTFRFAELVNFFGGTEATAGRIVSAGMFGALLVRLFLGQAIDRFGVRKLWLFSATCVTLGCLGFVFAGGVGWPIYTARVLFSSIGLAGSFTCSMVHVQNMVPPHRRTEVIASLGSSGFVGMFLGTQLGDGIFEVLADHPARFWVLFGAAAAMGIVYAGLVIAITTGDRHVRPATTPALLPLLAEHWPGMVMLVACQMGTAFTVISVFLTRFVTENSLGGIAPFFLAYTISAFSFRVIARNWNTWIGRHRMVMLGCAGQALGCSLFPLVGEWWQLVGPALFMGFGHALLFPAVVSLGVGAFPRENRGSGTTVILGFTEVGAMIAGPVLGWIIDAHGFAAMFLTAGGTALVTGTLYALTAARTEDEDLSFAQPPILAECTTCATLVPNTDGRVEACPVCGASFVEPEPLHQLQGHRDRPMGSLCTNPER